MSRTHRPTNRAHGLRRVTGWLTRLVSVAAVAAALVLAAVTVVPTVLGYERYIIAGDSMTGSLSRGDVAIEKTVPVEDLRIGDVITYVPPASSGVDNLVTHRIVAITPDERGTVLYRTKGDANADPDPWVFQLDSAEQPRLEFAIPKVGTVLLLLADRTFRMALIGVPAAVVALATLVELVRSRRPARPVSLPQSIA